MEIDMKLVNNAVLLEAENSDQLKVSLDGSEKIGGVLGGFRPMEMVLAALGGCSSMDILSILKKQKQSVDGFKIHIEGVRSESVPSPFTGIHMHFSLEGDISEKKLERALDLGINKYCSVGFMLEKTADISYSCTLNNRELL